MNRALARSRNIKAVVAKPGVIQTRFFSDVQMYQPDNFMNHSKHMRAYDNQFGAGGRASVSGITATVFGSYGFMGSYVINELGKCGSRVYIPFRGCEMEIRHLKPSMDLGNAGYIPFHPRDKDSILYSIQNSDIVINMIGKHYETKHIVPTRRADGNLSRINYTHEEVNVTIPRLIAECCNIAGVDTLVHMSALSADLDSSSIWSRTKAEGEIAIREEFKDAIIVKPATVFGAEDRFLNWIGDSVHRIPAFPLLNGGQTVIQPVFANDVAKALMNITVHNEQFKGKTFQLYGPAEYSYKEIVEFVMDITTVKKPLIDVPSNIASFAGRFSQELANPILTEDHIAQMLEDNVAKEDSDMLTFDDLGITPESMDKVAFDYLHRFRPGGHFTQVEGYH